VVSLAGSPAWPLTGRNDAPLPSASFVWGLLGYSETGLVICTAGREARLQSYGSQANGAGTVVEPVAQLKKGRNVLGAENGGATTTA